MDNKTWIERSNKVFIPTYIRFPTVMATGSGCRLQDEDGNEYLDFLAGIAVCSLGHCHPAITEAICNQARQLIHVSNLFHTKPQTELAELLIQHSFADLVFMANSGAEANEAAIKLARKFSGRDRYEIISLEGSFHGRTLATVTATGQPKFHEGFEPLPTGFRYAPFGDIEPLERLITPQTCAILCEPIQGESGVRPLSKEYMKSIRKLCDRHNLLLIFDEVQTGMGRTGTLFAYEQCGITPDIMTLAKALGNGMPIGAMLTTEKIGSVFTPGTHASTFGGNPVAAAAGVATVKTMLAEGFLADVREKGDYFTDKLNELAKRHPQLAIAARGVGLLKGLVLTEKGVELGATIVEKLFQKGMLINFAGNAVLRFIPPLVVTKEEIDMVVDALDKALREVS